MKSRVVFASALTVFCLAAPADEFRIKSASRVGEMHWSGAFTAGVCTVETAPAPGGPWLARANYFTSNQLGGAQVAVSGTNTFCRLLAVDISTNTSSHYTNLLQSYGVLETLAGKG